MAPIYDTDVAEERWDKAAWQNYELWEKIEFKLRRRRNLWILGTIILFLLLSAVPVVRDRLPRWTSFSAIRQLAQEINHLKRDANLDHAAYRIRFTQPQLFSYQIEKLTSCADSKGVVIRSGALLSQSQSKSYLLLTSEHGENLDIPGVADQFCYDYLTGNQQGVPRVSFGIIPTVDFDNSLTESRIDRLSLLTLKGTLAEISLD